MSYNKLLYLQSIQSSDESLIIIQSFDNDSREKIYTKIPELLNATIKVSLSFKLLK